MLFLPWASEIVKKIRLLGVTALNPSPLGFKGIAFCMRGKFRKKQGYNGVLISNHGSSVNLRAQSPLLMVFFHMS